MFNEFSHATNRITNKVFDPECFPQLTTYILYVGNQPIREYQYYLRRDHEKTDQPERL